MTVGGGFNAPALKAGWNLEGVDGEGQPLRIAFSDRQLGGLQLGLTIGRHPRLCDRIIDDVSVSRRHLRLGLSGGDLFAEDLNSLNGSLIGARRLRPFELAPLAVGESLLLGRVRLRLQRTAGD